MMDKMKLDIANKFGLEHPLTIDFYKVCESGNKKKIIDTYETFMRISIEEDWKSSSFMT